MCAPMWGVDSFIGFIRLLSQPQSSTEAMRFHAADLGVHVYKTPFKAVVGGPAGPAMAGPLFLPRMQT